MLSIQSIRGSSRNTTLCHFLFAVSYELVVSEFQTDMWICVSRQKSNDVESTKIFSLFVCVGENSSQLQQTTSYLDLTSFPLHFASWFAKVSFHILVLCSSIEFSSFISPLNGLHFLIWSLFCHQQTYLFISSLLFCFFSWSCSLILSRDAILQINRNNFDCWFLYWNHSEYKSKRMPLRKKYKIERKCREYKRKLRREARKNPQKRKSW